MQDYRIIYAKLQLCNVTLAQTKKGRNMAAFSENVVNYA
ncbi:hypothetical protein IMCC14465_13920 [alpha proteobacterium IMCC14465]|uniref:Uncharacterized protein n=1 Tax=alpha proteobacterium IMCC14465 TaxID=1220535 RepID=J9DI75_9PROT|nr:hypothetical protein IMCC14465_13920 [alpha proteobacterium IMCC14465]